MSNLNKMHADSLQLRRLINNLLERSAETKQKAA